MKVSLKDDSACRKTMSVEVPADTITMEYAVLLKSYVKSVALPGFRKGKAPKGLVEKKYAKTIIADLKERLVPKYYKKAVEENDLRIVSVLGATEPKLEEGTSLTFDVTLDVFPEFKLPKYLGIVVKPENVHVEDKQVNDMVDSIRRQHATFNDIEDRPARETDMVQISYESTVDGVPLEEKVPEARGMGTGNGYWTTCDDDAFLPGVGKALIGSSIGDKKDITVEFPESFIVKELANIKAEFKVEVTAMRERELPEFDEEFLKKLEVGSEEEFRARIREHLEQTAQKTEKSRQQNAVCEFLLKKTKIEVPLSAVQEQIHTLMKDIARRRTMQGVGKEQLAAQSGEIMEEAKTKGEEQVKLRYIVLCIADAEKIEAEDVEISEEIARMAVQQGKDASDFRKELEKVDGIDSVCDQIRFTKTVDFLLEKAKEK